MRTKRHRSSKLEYGFELQNFSHVQKRVIQDSYECIIRNVICFIIVFKNFVLYSEVANNEHVATLFEDSNGEIITHVLGVPGYTAPP